MLNYVGAAILMLMNFKDLTLLNISNDWDIEGFKVLKPMTPFSDEVVSYLNSLSKELNKNVQIKSFSDVATFSFYCRKSNILQLKKKYHEDNLIKLGRGIVFHIAPSNVAVNFAYSLIVGLLAGNANIVRVPTKYFEQVNIIVSAIKSLSKSDEHKSVSNRIILVRYDHVSNVTEKFSSICDVRIIWGGDETITRIRENKLQPRAFDITFSDRYSLCMINADKYAQEQNHKAVASDFFNDTYLFDQNACTSPHLVIWIGTQTNVKRAQSLFWSSLHSIIKNKYHIQPVVAIDKITNFYDQAIHMESINLTKTADNLLWRINLDELSINIDMFRCNSGYFSEYHAIGLSELSKIINKKYQTLAYYGFSKKELQDFIYQFKPSGIDRIVPIGKTMDFSFKWDGYDLITALSREIEIV